MKNRIDCRFRESLRGADLRLTSTKIVQKSDLVRSWGRFFCFPAKVSHSEPLSGRCGADERGTHPLYEHVSHNNPRENVF